MVTDDLIFPLIGPFSRSAVNVNAGCKTAVSNIVMAIAVMITMLLLTPLFYYTPSVVLSSIIIAAMLGLIDYEAAIHLWHVDKFDFLVCISAYVGVVFANIEVGLVLAVSHGGEQNRTETKDFDRTGQFGLARFKKVKIEIWFGSIRFCNSDFKFLIFFGLLPN